jgi:type II secretion system protein G
MSKLFKFNQSSFKKGFTLIELLVVVSIIGMLSSIILVSVQSARNKARDAKLILEIKELTKAMELYRLDNNSYPADGWWHSTLANCPVANSNGNRTLFDNGTFDASFLSKYMPSFPKELVTC